MKINAKISILFADNGLRIEVYDEQARVEFLSIRLDEKQTCQALSRVANTECLAEVRHLDKVGKTRESQNFEFEMPEDSEWGSRNKATAANLAQQLCPEGWIASTYFGSQNSFFNRDGKRYARTTIHRWVDAE